MPSRAIKPAPPASIRQPYLQRTPVFVGRPPRRAALRISLLYALFGSLWIIFSDTIIELFVNQSTIHHYHLQTIKGWLFVAVTAILLYLLIRRTVESFHRTEAARSESEDRLKLLIERAPDYAIFTLDAAGNVTSWNRGAQQITDWRESEIVGQHIQSFYTPEDVAGNVPQNDLDRARADGFVETESVRIRQDGTQFWAHMHITAVRGSGSLGSGFLVVLRDVTERRRVQDALRQVNQTLATVIENSPLAIITLDLNGNVGSWNLAAQRLFQFTPQETIGKPLPVIPPERIEHFRENNRLVNSGQRLEAIDVVGQRKDRSRFDVSAWAAPLYDPRGKIVGNVRLYADISERKRWENEIKQLNELLERRVAQRTAMLEEANEELQAFSYTVSHDLQVPLRSLQSIATDLLSAHSQTLDETGQSDALRIVGAAARMQRQIEDLLEYSRLARQDLHLEAVSLILIVHELIGRLERDPACHNAQFVVQEPLGWVKAHALTLQYVILNLLVNGCTHVEEGVRPAIHISAENKGPVIRLWIADNAVGIDGANAEKLFQSPGLGLSLVRRGIERMGGAVGVESAATGSRFWIELPRAD